MRASLILNVLVLLLAVMVHATRAAQEPAAKGGAAVSSGTLNLILANRNGFVIAADSRRSDPRTAFNCGGVIQHYCDDSQKLFRTAEKSAMVIAGFAAGGRNG